MVERCVEVLFWLRFVFRIFKLGHSVILSITDLNIFKIYVVKYIDFGVLKSNSLPILLYNFQCMYAILNDINVCIYDTF